MMLLQIAAGSHPLNGTVAEWVWLLPILPFLGFLINGGISIFSDAHADAHAVSDAETHGAHGDDHHAVRPHRYAGIVSIIGPLVLAASFVLAFMIFSAMRA